MESLNHFNSIVVQLRPSTKPPIAPERARKLCPARQNPYFGRNREKVSAPYSALQSIVLELVIDRAVGRQIPIQTRINIIFRTRVMPVPPDDTLPADNSVSSSSTVAPPSTMSTEEVLEKLKQLNADAALDKADGDDGEDEEDGEGDGDEGGAERGAEGSGGVDGTGGEGEKQKKKKRKGKASKAVEKLK